MEHGRQFVARAIYHHFTRPSRHITLIILKNPQTEAYWMVSSESTRQEPECWDGTREEILERWRHCNRTLQAEWFLHEARQNPENDFDEFL